MTKETFSPTIQHFLGLLCFKDLIGIFYFIFGQNKNSQAIYVVYIRDGIRIVIETM